MRGLQLVFALLILYSMPLRAMDFTFTQRMASLQNVASELTMSGPIVRGDYDRFVALLREQPADTWMALKEVRLQSPGGDIDEAMRLATTLQGLYVHTQPRGDCASACVLLYMAGSWRYWREGRIGLHRPSFAAAAYRGMSPEVARGKYSDMEQRFRDFLLRQGMPLSIYERLLSTSSEVVYWASEDDLVLLGGFPPYYEELLTATCGPVPQTDEERHAYRKCDAKLSLRAKAATFDEIMRGTKNEWWSRARAVFLK